jgi:flagellin
MTVINTNYNSIVAQYAMSATEKKLSTAMQQLSNGLKINSSKDDAAGLAIVNRMTSQVIGLTQANQNANDAINLIQTAEGATANITSITQKMRQLALESANGTYTDAQRQDADLEFQQLKNQVVSIADQTSWNGMNIMNGTAGINIGELPAIKNTSQYQYSSNNTLPVMNNGDLIINGVNVGASFAIDDKLSPADNAAASAIAKAAAINRVTNTSNQTSLTGVTAVVNPNIFTGAAMYNTNIVAGGFIINGFHTEIINSTLNDLSANRSTAIKAINSISNQTGVSAIDTGSNSQGISLIAQDGRNIEVKFDTQSSESDFASSFGLKEGSQASTISLESNIKDTITLTSLPNGSIANAGFNAQVLTKNQSIFNSLTRPISQSDSTINALQNADLVINGVPIRATTNSDDIFSNSVALSSNPAASAIAISNAINSSSSLTGVSAVPNPATIVGSNTSTGSSASGLQSLFINGTAIKINLTQNESIASRLKNVVNAINLQTISTGVTATENSNISGIILQSDGRNISTWYNSSVNGLSSSSFGLGSDNLISQVDQINITSQTLSSPTVTDNSQISPPTIKFQVPANQNINLDSVSTPDVTLGSLSISNGILYKGDGTNANAIGTIQLNNDPVNGGSLNINLNYIAPPANIYFYPGTPISGTNSYVPGSSRFFQFVPSAGVDWTTANSLAHQSTLYGNQGYLATITSQDEENFIRTSLPINTDVWLGGSDASQLGVFRWVTGPENNDVTGTTNFSGGTIFSTGLYNPVTAPGEFANFNSGEPNNAGTGESSLEMYSSTGKWNDLAPTGNSLNGYLVEYGGYPDSFNPNFVSATDLDKLNALVSTQFSPPVQSTVTINNVNVTSSPSLSASEAISNLVSAIQNDISAGLLKNISIVDTGSSIQVLSTVPGTPFSMSGVTFTGGNYLNSQVAQLNPNQPELNGVTGIINGSVTSNSSETVYGSVKLTANNQTIPHTTDIESLQDIPIPTPPSPINITTGSNGFNSNSQFTNLGFQVGNFGGEANSSFISNQIGRLSFQVGSGENQLINIDLPNFSSNGSVTGLLTNDANLPNNKRTVNIATQENASNALSIIDSVIENLSAYQSVMGAKMNRLSYTSTNLITEFTNQKTSESGVRDTDYASTSSNLAKYQIISSAANAIIAQANTSQESVLNLLK